MNGVRGRGAHFGAAQDIRHLILIREFFVEARFAPSAETPFLRLKRSLHLDLCVELALNAVVRDFGTAEEQREQGGRRDLPRDKLWELADRVVSRVAKKTLPERSSLKTLHELRNLAQHRGTAASADEVRRAVEPVRSLLDLICREIYAVDFDRLRTWEALEHAGLRAWIADCFEAIDRGAPFLAAGASLLAYKRVVRAVRGPASLSDASLIVMHAARLHSEDIVTTIEELVDDFQETLIDVEAELVAVSLGISISDHTRFHHAARGIIMYGSHSAAWSIHPHDRWPADDEVARTTATLMCEYLGLTCVLLESAYPRIFSELVLPGRLCESAIWAKSAGRLDRRSSSTKRPAG